MMLLLKKKREKSVFAIKTSAIDMIKQWHTENLSLKKIILFCFFELLFTIIRGKIENFVLIENV